MTMPDPSAIRLRRMAPGDIETVRGWRNSADVARFMEFQEHITPAMQQEWFGRVNNGRNYYFVVEVDQRGIGVVNLKDVDTAAGTAEAGIFLIEDPARSLVAYPCALAILRFAFDVLGLSRVRAHILRDNTRAIRFNLALGYVLCDAQDQVANQKYYLDRHAFEKVSMPLAKRIQAAGLPVDLPIDG